MFQNIAAWSETFVLVGIVVWVTINHTNVMVDYE